MTTEQESGGTFSLPRKLLISISLLQGFALYFLYKSAEQERWPSEEPLWLYPLWTLAIAVPLILLLSLDNNNGRKALALTGLFSIVLALLAVYTGWQAEPFGEFSVALLTSAFIFSITIACFKALMYLQQECDGRERSYQLLFQYSWRNFLVTALSSLFVLCFFLILQLWGSLFAVIEIKAFQQLFEKDWFLFPALTTAFGFGVIIFRELTHIIDGITRLLQGLIKLLLPLVVVIAFIFLCSLPVVGLDILWSTGRGTALLLWLLASLLFFTNAVYQDGRVNNPYPLLVHRLVYVGLLALPAIAGLAFYGLYLRIAQYGWTVERAWGMIVWVVLALFALGYAWGIVTRRDQWPQRLASVNVAMGLVVLGVMLAANSPLLDLRKLSLGSQLKRLEAGRITPEAFDYYYLDRYLARPGHLALQRLADTYGADDPALLAKIQDPQYSPSADVARDYEQAFANALYRPADATLPTSLKQYMIGRSEIPRWTDDEQWLVLQVDLNDDGNDDYLIGALSANAYAYQFYYENESGWNTGYVSLDRYNFDKAGLTELREGEVRVVRPEFNDLEIGDIRMQLQSSF